MKKLLPLIFVLIMITACSAPNKKTEEMSYRRISMEEAAEMMQSDSTFIIVDVRRSDEFAEGHIPNAINIPNENIGEEEIPDLPDKNRIIMVYCRSGNRSKQASEKLVKLGYTNVIEFGGIMDWSGEIEK
ncbi:MAG: rhodanese-like domain-containing protein [Clostridia bacterium]|nr:rhodanese-like domain-containing protein [Clostridia bacterium]